MKVLLRKWHGRFDAVLSSGGSTARTNASPSIASLLPSIGFLCCALAIAVIAMLALPILLGHAVAGVASLPFAGMAVGQTLDESKKRLQALLGELKTAETELQAGGVKKERRDEINAKFEEAKGLQEEIDQAEKVFTFNGKMREVPEHILPKAKDSRTLTIGDDGSEVVGWQTIGSRFVNSEAFKNYIKGSMSKGTKSSVVQFEGLNELYVPITRKMIESKAVPTIGDGVVLSDRKPLVVQTTADIRTNLRDVINVSRTDSPLVTYLVEDTYTEAADVVAESAAKPEATMGYTEASAPVRTLAVHMPVTEQQLQDVPQMQNLIDNRLRYDLRRLEEKQMMWGSGTGQNLAGIIPLAGVTAISRTVTDTQNLDRIRIGITDVLVNGYEPNALVIHPYDWEAIVLLKDDTKNYLWTIVTDPQTGNSRVWGLAVVESVAAKSPSTTTRDFVVGDFLRGATLYDRQLATVDVGWIDDQFILNQRTVRAEERVAFAVHAPKAFKKYETAA